MELLRKASRWPIGSEVSLGPDRGTVVAHATYSLTIRKADGLTISGSTGLIRDEEDVEALADAALAG
jgi:hypothetical protein